ncbi:MAG: AAA family ATPase [Nanoarchaeota archaeon]|nr:AAA family ATPase [Nanoarchaeota archaeon]MBU1027990.1 AAA family ATPase [Nanoarchaeota archaeon]
MIPETLQNLKFCRIKKGTKKPFESDWVNKPYSYSEIKNFLPDENYGVLCGYDNLAVIDADSTKLQMLIDGKLPQTFKVKTGNGMHNYFFVEGLKKKIILKLEGEHIGEVQSQGTQVIGPGSVHPSGKIYEAMNDIPITNLNYDQLIEFVKPFQDKKEIPVSKIIQDSDIDNLSVVDIWGTAGLKKQGSEYYGSHPIHGSETKSNFWINPFKNTWHCFRCNSGGGPAAAIAVKEGLMDCSDAKSGSLRKVDFVNVLKIAEEKYGLKPREIKEQKVDLNIIWEGNLKDYETEGLEWIIEKIIANRSVCLLVGKAGVLKTFLAILICYAVASGNDFLNKFKSKKGKVIYLDKENGYAIMKKRTSMVKKGLGLTGEYDIGFICFSSIKIDKKRDIEAIEKILEEHKPKLLVIDTYRRAISFDENDAGSVSELFVDTLRPLVEKYNCSILLLHHNRKGGSAGDEMDELRGSSDLANYADAILKAERKGGNLVLKQLKNRNESELPPMKLLVTFLEDEIKMVYSGEFVKKNKEDKCIEVLKKWFKEKGIKEFQTNEGLEKAANKGIGKTNFNNALKTMEVSGIIEKVSHGQYKVL